VIDLHCHVLPGIDDGPDTLDDSLALCRAAAAAGTRTVVATPHVSWDWPNVTSRVVADGVARVNEALEAEGVDLEVRPGAEVAMTRAGDLEDSELVALRLGGGPYLLVECPFSPAAAGFDAILDVAEEQDADLIVIGNKGMTGAKRFLLGSVPNKVSHHAPCSVLIIRTT
jgi:protein-tyrosine phosphatase